MSIKDTTGTAAMRKGAIVFAVVAGFVLLSVLAACQSQGGSSAQTSEPEAQQTSDAPAAEPAVAGGWTVATDEVASQLTPDQQESFAQAMEGYTGLDLTPVAALGTQVVAGLNTAYLCQGTTVTATPETGWYVAVVYQDLEGGSSITSVNEIDISDVKTADTFESGLAGGWQLIPNSSDAIVLPEGASGAWAKATEAYEGELLVPIAVLGSQVVAGTNYLAIASSTGADEVTTLHVVTLYADLEGSGSFTDDALFDLLAYV